MNDEVELSERLILIARRICPGWMTPNGHAHYCDVKRAIKESYEIGQGEPKIVDSDQYREGMNANDHNRRLNRINGNGERITNPYLPDSKQYTLWQSGYNYRDMVNDG